MGRGMDAQHSRNAVPYSRGYVRWAIGLVFVVSMFNVIDRTIVALLVPGIQADLELNDTQVGLLLGPSFGARSSRGPSSTFDCIGKNNINIIIIKNALAF